MKASWKIVEGENLRELQDQSFPEMKKRVCSLSLEANAGIYPVEGAATLRQADGKVVTISSGTKICVQDTAEGDVYEVVDLSVLMVEGSVVSMKEGVTISLLRNKETGADGNGIDN